MDIREFGTAYRDLNEKKTPSNPERREILEAPRQWMRFFNDTTKNYLAGNEPPEQTEFIEKMGEYYAWTQMYLGTLMQEAREIDNPAEKNDIATEFSFHQINGPLTFLWPSLLYSETNLYTPQDITDMQVHLAVSMADSSNRLKKINHEPKPETLKEYRSLKGLLSEVDTVVALMELLKIHPHLMIVPAPELFESNHAFSSRNADILVFDTVAKQVQGVQVKTNTVEGSGGDRHYNQNFVTVVDGTYELGGTTYDKQRRRRQDLPGQLAMGLLSTRPINPPTLNVPKPMYMRARQISIELSRGRKPFIDQAAQHLSSRILPKLKEKSSS